jgi:RimJ/RimL family protein N-acetyltransferase
VIDRLVGTVEIRREDGVKRRHKSMVVAMFVRTGNRRSGVGEMLIRTTIRHARSWEGVEQIQLVVNDVAPEAKRLYERCGFRSWGIEPHSLRHDGVYTDAIHMILQFDSVAEVQGQRESFRYEFPLDPRLHPLG